MTSLLSSRMENPTAHDWFIFTFFLRRKEMVKSSSQMRLPR